MALYDSQQANYGRGQFGQFSPFRDTAKRRHASPEDEEMQQQAQQQAAPQEAEPAPSPLAKAIAPQQSYGTTSGTARGVFSKQDTQPVVDQVRREAKSGSFGDQVQSPSQATSYTGSSAQASPLEKAIAPTASAGGGAGYTLSNRGGAGGGSNQFTGFDFGQSDANRDTGKSAKYAFADLASQSGVAMPTTKEGAEAWARQYIVPGMNALGHEVLDVKGDKMLVRNWQGEGWVDFLVNADGANPQLAWQAEGGGGAIDPLASAVGGGAADPVAMTLAQQMGIDTSNPLWKQILDQLIADQSGQQLPHATVRV